MSTITRKNSMQKWKNTIFILPFMILFILWFALPLLINFFLSFTEWNLLTPYKLIGLDNYIHLLNDEVFWSSLKNTIVFAFSITMGVLVISLITALVVHEINRTLIKTIFRGLFFFPYILSISVISILWQWLLNNKFGLINYYLSKIGLPSVNWLGDPNMAKLSIIITTIWWTSGFAMVVIMTGLQNIPKHILEAAEIDGASWLRRLLLIRIPLLKPIILFVTVTQLIGHLKIFAQVMLMTAGGPGNSTKTLVYHFYTNGFRFLHMGYAAAIAYVLLFITLIISVIQFNIFGWEGNE